MDKEPIKYYDYYQIGELINTDVRILTNILLRLNIFTKGKDPGDLTLYRKNIVSPRFVIERKLEYKSYFRESFGLNEEGVEEFRLEVTDAFIEFAKKLIQDVKEGKK